MNVVVLVEQVPDTCSEQTLRSVGALDRDATHAVLDEINERAVEAALQLKEAGVGSGDGSEGAGGTVSIPRRISRWRTLHLALTGCPLDAVTAQRWGLVDVLEPAGEGSSCPPLRSGGWPIAARSTREPSHVARQCSALHRFWKLVVCKGVP